MVTVDIKSLLLHLNSFCTNALQNAAGLCVSRTHYEITVEHLFTKLLEDPDSDLPLIFRQFDLDPGRVQKALDETLEEFKTGNAARPVFSPLLMELLQDAWLIASIDLGEKNIRSGAILLSFLGKPAFFAMGRYVDLIKKIGRETLVNEFWAMTKSSVEKTAAVREPGAAEPVPGKADGGFLARFCTDFTERARAGGIDPVFGRDNEIRQMIDILARRRKNNPICVGEPGVGKTAVVEGMALRIVEGDVPDLLRDVTLLGLDMGLLEAGAGVKGEFETRLKGVINEIKASEKPIILFIDEAHTLIGAGGTAGGSDAANLLKPALARGELRTVAATTWTEYKKYFEKDPAMARRFQLVKLDEPSVDTTKVMLRGLKASYEGAHKVIVRDDAVESAVNLSDRYITGRFLPDKAIDLLDTSCARVKINLTAKPAALEDKERTFQALEREIKALDRDRVGGVRIDKEKYLSVVEKKEKTSAEADEIRERWLKEKEAAQKVIEIREERYRVTESASDDREGLEARLAEAERTLADIQGTSPLIQTEVNPDVVAQVVSDWTGIPLGKVLKDEAQTIINLDERMKERIKGQDHALSSMAEVIRAAKSGIKNPNQPIGVFLLVGPSGTGKTESGLVLADLLFGSERHVVTINMSEFQEAHTLSRLIGSPPGYVGYGEGGMLTEAVRQKPYSVVLLDEVEKANIDVMNLFYQVFDKGMLTDGEGKEINFKNTILILTSNLASDIIQEMTATGEAPPLEAVLGAVRPILSKHFKPALLARMTVIPFYSLNTEAMRLIVELKLKKIQKMLMENNRMAMTYAPAVVDRINERCTEVETGARNIEYILNGNVLPRLSRTILSHITEGGLPMSVHLDVDETGAFTFAFS
ncbi:MAG: type VI secretion system ATPase TssH [Syntrophobacterales bacterium]|nr:type VI secretion system ATPase TssH [Syntrophobacterales bacterium]